MDPKPFTNLKVRRVTGHGHLPNDLRDFFVEHEGVGLGSSSDRLVRLGRLTEVRQISWRDVHIFGTYEFPGWERFFAYRIGVSSFFDEIHYVIDAPVCPSGSILTIGVDVAGPGGTGELTLEPTLVLASSFPEWIEHLEKCVWIEYGLVPGDIPKLTENVQRQLRRYYKTLNPKISWGIE